MNTRPSYREQVQRLREDSIVEAVHRLLSSKGYEQMTVDEVAAEAGIAKASLYKHFTSKEELAGAAMVRVLDQALAFVEGLRGGDEGAAPAPDAALERLRAVASWAMQRQLEGGMPSLPSQNSSLTESLKGNEEYMDRLIRLSTQLGTWIAEAQAGGRIDPRFPTDLVLYTLFARACDPVVGMLQSSGQYENSQIVEWVAATTFDGLRPR